MSLQAKTLKRRDKLPYIHDLYLQFCSITLPVVGKSHAISLTKKRNDGGSIPSIDCVSPLEVTS